MYLQKICEVFKYTIKVVVKLALYALCTNSFVIAICKLKNVCDFLAHALLHSYRSSSSSTSHKETMNDNN